MLVQNEFLQIEETKFLHQLQLEEQFGVNSVEEKSKKKIHGGAAIAFQYDDTASFAQTISNIEATAGSTSRYDEFAKDSSDSEDLDLTLDMSKIGNEQAHGLNIYAHRYGMESNDFYSFLTKDIDDAESLKLQKEEEEEKILYCGRKGRRERRAQRERRFNVKLLDADAKPSYALDDKKVENENKQDSESRSPSPEAVEKITYITSFGGDEEISKKMSFSEKVKENLGALKRLNEASRRNAPRRRYSSSDSSNDKHRYRRRDGRRQYNRRRSRSRGKRLSRSKSRSSKGSNDGKTEKR